MMTDPVLDRLLEAFLAVGAVATGVFLVQRAVRRYVTDTTSRYRIGKVIVILGYLAAALLLLSIFSDRLRGVTVALGVAGAGIAFALQEVIASTAGWIAISLGHFYKTGDRVQLGGISGDVIDIGILRTTIMETGAWVRADLYNGRIVRVSNSFIFKEPVYNYSGEFPFLWDEIVLPVSYGSDPQEVRRLLRGVTDEVIGGYVPTARAHWEKMLKRFLLEAAPVETAVTMELTDNGMEFAIRYVVDFKERRTVKDRLFERILEEFARTGGRVGLASTSTEVSLTAAPEFAVRVTGTGTEEGR